MHEAYGIFIPGSIARAIRNENYKLGLRTCGYCLETYPPAMKVIERREDWVGPGNYFCSWKCFLRDLLEAKIRYGHLVDTCDGGAE